MPDSSTPEPEQGPVGSSAASATTITAKVANGKEQARSRKPADDSWRDGAMYTITKWKVVGTWSYSFESDTCAICRNSLYEPSLDVQAMGDEVPCDHPGRKFARGEDHQSSYN